MEALIGWSPILLRHELLIIDALEVHASDMKPGMCPRTLFQSRVDMRKRRGVAQRRNVDNVVFKCSTIAHACQNLQPLKQIPVPLGGNLCINKTILLQLNIPHWIVDDSQG